MKTVDIVIPVYNEEQALEPSVVDLRNFLTSLPHQWKIIIADNASTDLTSSIGKKLQSRWPREVEYHRLAQKGRGRALRTTWLNSRADILTYMDVDLSTNLKAFLPMIQPLVDGKMSLATGCRLHRASKIERSFTREMVSRAYNLMIKMIFPRRRFKDAQCGFKAITRELARQLLPLVENDNWFFDSELLLLAERYGYRVHEVPVEWIEDPSTTVNIPSTATEDVKGLLRVRFTRKVPLPKIEQKQKYTSRPAA